MSLSKIVLAPTVGVSKNYWQSWCGLWDHASCHRRWGVWYFEHRLHYTSSMWKSLSFFHYL